MKENSVLYQIKVLDKMVIREFIKKKNCEISFLPTPTQMLILEYIFDHCNENIYQKDLEKVLNLRRATVSGVLQTMEKHDLIERVFDKNDARSKRIIIKKCTREMFEKRGKKFFDLEEKITQGLTSSELKEFFQIINKMQDNIIKYTLEANNGKDELC